jgi:hypothetical protein
MTGMRAKPFASWKLSAAMRQGARVVVIEAFLGEIGEPWLAPLTDL